MEHHRAASLQTPWGGRAVHLGRFTSVAAPLSAYGHGRRSRLEAALRSTFLAVDAEFVQQAVLGQWHDGSCAVCLMVRSRRRPARARTHSAAGGGRAMPPCPQRTARAPSGDLRANRQSANLQRGMALSPTTASPLSAEGGPGRTAERPGAQRRHAGIISRAGAGRGRGARRAGDVSRSDPSRPGRGGGGGYRAKALSASPGRLPGPAGPRGPEAGAPGV